MIVHLLDGTYELFRHFYGIRRGRGTSDPPMGAVAGVLHTVLQMLEGGATHLGVATDHVIESFRNDLWPGYKTARGDRAGACGAVPAARGSARRDGRRRVADGRARGRRRPRLGGALAAADARVEKVCIWTPDKDLAQCVVGDRVVQVDRKSGQIRNAEGCARASASPPERIPDYLALVGDAADGYPGVAGHRPQDRRPLHRADTGRSRTFRPNRSAGLREEALLFKRLATLRTDAPLFDDVDALRWRGPTRRSRPRPRASATRGSCPASPPFEPDASD